MKLRLFVFLILLPLAGYTQFNDTAYVFTFGGIQNEVCYQAKPCWDGGYIFIGRTNSFGPGGNNFYAVKTDSLCKHQWSCAYGGKQLQEGFSVTPTLDKGFAFLGFTDSYGAGGYDMYLIKTDSNGKMLWQKTYGGSDWDFGYSITQTKDSGFVMCGLTYSYGAGNGDMYVVRTDKKGDTLWTRAIGGNGYDAGNSIYVLEDSLYYIAGVTTSFGRGDTSMYFVEIDNKGIIKWDTTCGSKHNTVASSINGTTNSGFVVYGSLDSIPDSTYVRKYNETIIKFDSNRKIQWWDIFKAILGGEGIGKDAVQTQAGNYLTVGTTDNCGAGGLAMDFQLINIGGYWQNAACFGGTGDEYGNTIAYRNKNNVLFAGATNSPGYGAGLFDFYVIRLTSDSIISGYKLKIKSFTDTLDPASVESVSSLDGAVRVFPNPMVDYATVLLQANNESRYHIILYDMLGHTLVNTAMIPGAHLQYRMVFNRGNLTCGSYPYLIMDQEDKIVASGKLLVE